VNRRGATAAAAITVALASSGCEFGPKQTQQTGYRGAGLQQISDPDHVARAAAIPAPPYELPPDGGISASEAYENVKVLNDLSAERFNHLMASITQWVAPPEQGCTYCHNPENMASDEKYTKIVARRMLQMTRAINGRWTSHVQQTGVTCWTCHRGNTIPAFRWSEGERTLDPTSIRGNKRGQNTPDANVGYASLPNDPFGQYLRGGNQIRVASSSSYPRPDHVGSIKGAEASYGLMMHISYALGVNCTYCHNSQSFRSWTLSRAQRATAYYGIRMVRNINDAYVEPLAPILPADQKGPHGDAYKVNCTTCHQGLSKPLGGVSMLADYPELKAPVAVAATPEAGQATAAAFRNPGQLTKAQ